MERSLHLNIENLRIPTNTYTTAQQTSCKKRIVSSLFNRAYSIINNKDHLSKVNTRIKQVLKENGYQERIISKIFKRITNNHSLPQSQQQTQVTDIHVKLIRMSINVLYVKGTIEKLWHIQKSQKIRSTFYTESTLSKLLRKLKDRVATEDKNNVAYENDSSKCEAVYFSESK